MDLTLPQQIAQMDSERLRGYQENLGFYGGAQWPGQARRRERRLTVNYVRAFLEKATTYLTGGLAVDVQPADASAEAADRAERARQVLHQTAEASNLEQLDFDTELDAAVLGDGCYKLVWDPQEECVRVTAPDVQGIFAWADPDDYSRVWRIANQYRMASPDALALYGVASRGGETTVVEMWTKDTLAIWVDGAAVTERANPYGFIPFLLFPNVRRPKQFWGLSDIPPLVEPQQELNRALSQLSMILELSGNPIAVLEGVEEARDIAVQPGAVWELPEQARAHLLDLLQGGGVRLHVEFIDLLYRALHDLAEAPRVAFGYNNQNLSGVALEMEMHPLLQKVHRKRLIRTPVYRRRAELTLRLYERFTGVKVRPVRLGVRWGTVLPQDRARLVQEQIALVNAGLRSRDRALAELGGEDPALELGLEQPRSRPRRQPEGSQPMDDTVNQNGTSALGGR